MDKETARDCRELIRQAEGMAGHMVHSWAVKQLEALAKLRELIDRSEAE